MGFLARLFGEKPKYRRAIISYQWGYETPQVEVAVIEQKGNLCQVKILSISATMDPEVFRRKVPQWIDASKLTFIDPES
jgi:hypothetical protein